MKAQADATTRVILTGLAQLEERSLDAPIDLYRDVQEWAFDAFSQAFWGRVLEHQFYAWFRTLADMGSKRINSKLPKWIPPLNPLFYRHRFSWYRELGAEVAKARTSHEHGEDLLRFSIRNGCPLDDESLTEAVATNFFGGVFSCSSTVITALYLLAQHPQERDRLVDALQSLPPDLPHDAVENCEPLNFVVREAMRFYPAVPLYFRNSSAQREVKLGPHTLPKDTLILISNCWLHRKSPHWEQPERFRPERWANGVAEENPIGSGHFFPFGRGPRMCIGFPFAMFFIRQALAAIYRTATVDLDPAQEYQQDFYFGVMLPKGLKARFTHRES